MKVIFQLSNAHLICSIIGALTFLPAEIYIVSLHAKCILTLIFLQMNLHHIENLYRRVEEMPFNSDTKYMAVKCTPKYGKVNKAN